MSERLEQIMNDCAIQKGQYDDDIVLSIGDFKHLYTQAERAEELEEELMTAHAPIGHLEQENKKLREALKEIQNLSYSDSASQAIVKARQALEEANNG